MEAPTVILNQYLTINVTDRMFDACSLILMKNFFITLIVRWGKIIFRTLEEGNHQICKQALISFKRQINQ